MLGLLVATLVGVPVGEVAAQGLAGVELRLTAVADSGGYYVYSYTLANPSGSSAGMTSVEIDISASSGTPENLAASGELADFSRPDGNQVPHAEVGPISPDGWEAILSVGAKLAWTVPATPIQSFDSIAPGDSVSGFGIRSSYLPDLTRVRGMPTGESCCLEPFDTIDGEPQYAMPEKYAVSGSMVAPRLMPSEVDIDLLRAQIDAVCTEPLWIDDAALCARLDELAGDALAHLMVGDSAQAAGSLDQLGTAVGGARSRMHSNAYWLLRLNVAQARENLTGVAPT